MRWGVSSSSETAERGSLSQQDFERGEQSVELNLDHSIRYRYSFMILKELWK